MKRIACLVVLAAGLSGCSPQGVGTVMPAAQAASVSTDYDAVRGRTYAELVFALDDSATAMATTTARIDGNAIAPFPADSMPTWIIPSGAGPVFDFAVFVDGERWTAEADQFGAHHIGADAIRAMATGSDVRVSVGAVSGPLPRESKQAIADFVALFE
jgi:hypothetical protein